MITNLYKPILFKEYFDAILSGKPLLPPTIEIEPTNLCQNHCLWCIDEKLRNNSFWNWNSIKSRLPNNPQIKSFVIKGGGEPLLYKDISNLLDFISGNGQDIGVITNGILIKMYSELLVKTCKWVRVSISSSNKDSYNATHRPINEQSFFDIISGIQEISDKVKTGICMVATNDNFEEIIPLIRLSKEIGAKYIDIKLGHGSKTNIISENLESISKEALSYNSNEFNVFINRLIPKSELQLLPSDYKCLAHFLIGIVTADGLVYPCCSLKGKLEYCLGDLNKEDFEKIWFGKRHQEVNALINTGKCKKYCQNKTSFARYDYYNSLLNSLYNLPSDRNFL